MIDVMTAFKFEYQRFRFNVVISIPVVKSNSITMLSGDHLRKRRNIHQKDSTELK